MYSRPLTLDACDNMQLCYSHFAYELSTMELGLKGLDNNGLTTDNIYEASVVVLGMLCFVFCGFFCARQLYPSPGHPNTVHEA